MYNMEQIHAIIDATPQEMKGKHIDDFRPRALSFGRRIDKETRRWWMVYLTWQGGKETYVVAKQGIIQ